MIPDHVKKTSSNLFPRLLTGGWAYYLWLSVLGITVAAGALAFAFQVRDGLIITGMRDPFPWGLYIANFAFLVGIAAAAVLVIIPSYIYHYQPLKEICLIGEFLSAASIVMALFFVVIDLGRPDRFWHILPGPGLLHFPQSPMGWDCLVLWGYLLLNLVLCGYILRCKYQGRQPNLRLLMPLVYLSIVWAISIHTVTAFIYCALSSVPSWHQAITIPRFLASAFASGPALLILILQVIGRYTRWPVEKKALSKLAEIMTVALFFNLFMLGAEILVEGYTRGSHFSHWQYLLFGLHGHTGWVFLTWTAVAAQGFSLILLLVPRIRCNLKLLSLCCTAIFAGIWLEKGIGLLAFGFIPSNLGEIFEYRVTSAEIAITAAIWAIGMLIITLLVKLTILIETGACRHVDKAQGEQTKAAQIEAGEEVTPLTQ
ncbi:MAG: sulfate reduction electron transfer complex DsrMKJOP subunit DsrP [bacterium]